MDKRFIVRKEFFGATIYDRSLHCYKLVDNDAYKQITSSSESLCSSEDILQIKESMYVIDNTVCEGRLSSPLRVYIDTTYVCNLNCSFCYNKTDKRSEKEVPVSVWENFFDQMADAGVMKLSIAGGEPFADENIFEVISAARERGLSVSMTSNGTLLNNRILQQLAESGLKRLTISVDSADESELETMRPGLKYSRFRDNIGKITKLGIDVAIKCTFNYNTAYSRLEDIVRFGASIEGVRSVKFNYERLTSVHEHIPTEHEVQAYFKVWSYLDALKDKYSSIIKVIFNQRNPAISSERKLNHLLGIGCPAGRDLLYVNPYGDVKGCALLSSDMKAGNIVTHSLNELWGYSDNLVSLRTQNIHNDCIQCEYLQYCGSGCTQRKFLNGGLGRKDYYCYKEYLAIRDRHKESAGLESYDLAHY
ncbi:radical SAM protein [Vibrio maritimus]|uniref:radical SAM protein n=1 Tax=Vibrio maritimus TaxID=990268 RepID=UPI0040681C87